MEIVSYGGWERCARLTAGNIELIVTLDVGPRVIRFGLIGGPNEFVEYAKDMGKTGGNEFRSYGGHRFWIAPELWDITYEPDNDPVEVHEEGEWTIFRTPLGACKLQKEIRIKLEPDGSSVLLEHHIHNRSEQTYEVAPWCLSVMAPGGECIVPQAPYKPHPDALLPARPVVLWHYTDMQDKRYTWGTKVLKLRQDPNMGPTKVGSLVQQGVAAYANHGNVFVKCFPYMEGEEYLDFGCNFESFTRQDMLEVESLGPKTVLGPNDRVAYREAWKLFANFEPPKDEEECAAWLEGIAKTEPV